MKIMDGLHVFLWRDPTDNNCNTYLIDGDKKILQGIGRTDLPGGDGKLLKESIQRLAAFDSEYLLSGHGEIISGAGNVRANFQTIEQEWFGYLQ